LIGLIVGQQTRSPTARNRDWSPVMHQTRLNLAC
jgi:hypothetical protein